MTHPIDHHDEALDALIEDIAHDELPADQVQRAVSRVWQRIAHEVETPLTSCADFQAAIPALLAGALSEARAMLVHDHTRACVPCRRVLLEARRSVAELPPTQHQELARGRRIPGWLPAAAAAVLVVGCSLIAWHSLGNLAADRRLSATIGDVSGILQLVDAGTAVDLSPGAQLRSHQKLRTGKGASAFLELADGSVVEIAERSELALSAARRGTTIELGRGNIIVHAAAQRSGRLYVATDHCEVAVKGTIFAVNRGLKGSRVSVIEGAVEVAQGSQREMLAPGEQLSTDVRFEGVSVEQEIGWSRNADEHIALLRELSRLNRDLEKAVNVAAARSSTRLLDLAPADTAIYAAMPNLSEGVAAARILVAERLAESPVLATWWQETVVASGADQAVNEVLDRLQPLGRAMGDEIVIAVPSSVARGDQAPLIMAILDDPEAFRAALQAELARLQPTAADDELRLILVDDLESPAAAADALYLWSSTGLFAASTDLERIRQLAVLTSTAAVSGFRDTDLHARLAASYAGGVEWLFGADLRSLAGEATRAGGDEESWDMARQLGILDATSVVLERHHEGERMRTDAVLDFVGPRRGLPSWLAAPGAMGSLDFVSPDAVIAVAFLAKDAAQMFDELLTAVSSVNDDALAELDEVQRALGFDLREDLVATLGGEAALTVDGPMLPTPAWKLVVEVYDPAHLHFTVEQAVRELNTALAAEGVDPVLLEVESRNGRDYRLLRHPGLGDSTLAYTIVDGYLIAAPSSAVIERAIAFRASGVTLGRSQPFLDLLPSNRFGDCSALSYTNFSALADAIPTGALAGLSGETARLISDSSLPSLFCAYGLEDQIQLSGSGGSLVGLGSMLSLPMALGHVGSLVDACAAPAEVSSRG